MQVHTTVFGRLVATVLFVAASVLPPGLAEAPLGTVAFFDGIDDCDQGAGWSYSADFAGVAPLVVNNPNRSDETAGQPLESRELADHQHDFELTMRVKPKVIAAAGGSGTDLGKAKKYHSHGSTDASNSDLPLIQMPVCMQGATDAVDSMPRGSAVLLSPKVPGAPNRCPNGWQSFDAANGRFVVPLQEGGTPLGMGGGPAVEQFGLPLTHQHGLSTEVDIGKRAVAASHSCCNTNPGNTKNRTIAGPADGAEGSLPYFTLMLCLKTETPTQPAPIAQGLVAFFPNRDSCPQGWSTNDDMRGRYLVGSALGDQATFGGAPLTDLENRVHLHEFSGEVALHKTEVVAAPGGDHHWAKKKKYDYNGESTEQGSGAPYIQMLTCTKD
ncbi:MAG: hypothetical protein AAGA68_10495 [Pseudomonadota bacterium]